MDNKIKNLLLEAIRYPRPEAIQKVCLPIWNQPFFFQIDKARALTISYNPTDKGARTNYPGLLARYLKNDFGDAEEIFDLLYNFKKEIYWRKHYDLFFETLGIHDDEIAHMDESFFPYQTFNDYLNNKELDDTHKFLLKTIELLSDNLKYILIDGAKNRDIVNLFIKDYDLIDCTSLPINSGKPHRLFIYKHKTRQTFLIYYECFLYGQTCPSKRGVENLANHVKSVIYNKETLNMNLKKCPKCELNYITDNAELCAECQKKISKQNTDKTVKKSSERVYNEIFTFTNEPDKLEGESGFKAKNSQSKYVGIVFMTHDKRSASYGCFELCFYPEYRS
ncbi:MAG: hypothetical protein K2N74_03910, partial [Clostridiales bacterium]|nr:hypothetical protein [Clostridiales bacterium]